MKFFFNNVGTVAAEKWKTNTNKVTLYSFQAIQVIQ